MVASTRQQYPPVRQHHADLPADPRAVAEARGLVRAAVRRWSVPVDVDIASVLASELVTNAVTHGNAAAPDDADGDGSEGDPASSPFVTLMIIEGLDCLRIEVRDTSRAQPVVKVPEADAERGRGLFLVETLAETWGCDRLPSGKAVYFILAFG
jgi:anti-sigma regulatory factor (Ser/Thr protein kinase)